MPPPTVQIVVIKFMMEVVVCEGVVTSVGGTVVGVADGVGFPPVITGADSLSIDGRGCEGETFSR